MTNRTKSEFTSHCQIAAKTNFLMLFPARFAHARYSSCQPPAPPPRPPALVGPDELRTREHENKEFQQIATATSTKHRSPFCRGVPLEVFLYYGGLGCGVLGRVRLVARQISSGRHLFPSAKLT